MLSLSKHQSLMQSAMKQLNLSTRAHHRILKLARTIADLVGCEEIQLVHLAEALHLRQTEIDVELERGYLWSEFIGSIVDLHTENYGRPAPA